MIIVYQFQQLFSVHEHNFNFVRRLRFLQLPMFTSYLLLCSNNNNSEQSRKLSLTLEYIAVYSDAVTGKLHNYTITTYVLNYSCYSDSYCNANNKHEKLCVYLIIASSWGFVVNFWREYVLTIRQVSSSFEQHFSFTPVIHAFKRKLEKFIILQYLFIAALMNLNLAK